MMSEFLKGEHNLVKNLFKRQRKNIIYSRSETTQVLIDEFEKKYPDKEWGHNTKKKFLSFDKRLKDLAEIQKRLSEDYQNN